MSYLVNALSFLLELAFGAAAALFVLRLAAEASRADFHNPLSQFIYRTTNPVLAPVRKLLPNWRRINIAALLAVWLLMLIKRVVLFALLGVFPHVLGLIVLSLADTLDFIAMFYVVLIFVWSLMSLFQVETYHPVYRLAGSLVDPLLRPLRGRLVAGGLDFGPWVVMIVLVLARLLLVSPLTDLGARLALGL
ncbi:MAG TPA: YggT family protein [Dyella sp.]|uniref:YggT family protein n=1 Tax=Dyella sp. TaxID=1869338 RepID=UPI002D78338A|nr:YggT family protein [Dyella sp.]HET6554987.1 YggT family protein [Dyella sp.]